MRLVFQREGARELDVLEASEGGSGFDFAPAIVSRNGALSALVDTAAGRLAGAIVRVICRAAIAIRLSESLVLTA